jgi:hypothetical protein
VIGPVEYQHKVLGRKLWRIQRQICKAVTTKHSVSIKGCHGSGKTFTIAGLVPYVLQTRTADLVLTIAPTLRQVKLMWREIDTAISAIPSQLPERTTTEWHLDEKRYAIGFSSSKGVNAQGFHGLRVLILADEAIGISTDLWDVIDGIAMAGDVRVVKLCNPTVPSGPVFDDFHKRRGDKGHECITISAFDTPNLHGLTMESLLQLSDDELDYAPFPMLARRRAVIDLYNKWGPTNPRFISRVLGEFPSQSDDSVFRLEWIERAALPYEPDDFKPYSQAKLYMQIGIDVAGPGCDETVATARIGPFVVAQQAWPDADPTDACMQWISAQQLRFPGHPVVLVGDTVGIGYYFMRYLARSYEVRCFVANAAPVDPVMYWDAKAEAYFYLRECMRDNHVIGLADETTQAQLSDIRYRERSGKIEIESKRESKARGGNSPDRAESLIMAYCRLVPREQSLTFGEGYRISPV